MREKAVIWFVLFVWLNETNQIDQINLINQTNQINQPVTVESLESSACVQLVRRFGGWQSQCYDPKSLYEYGFRPSATAQPWSIHLLFP